MVDLERERVSVGKKEEVEERERENKMLLVVSYFFVLFACFCPSSSACFVLFLSLSSL